MVTRGDTTELNAVLEQVEEAARLAGKRARRLWLDPLPGHISLASIGRRYGPLPKGGLPCVVGELDDPDSQSQRRYDIDLAQVGNVLLYGAQNSDVDGLMRAMLVSLAQGCDARVLWLYAVDFGAGTLLALDVLPQTGGVVLPGDDERLENLFRMLEDELAARRRELVDYGGSIDERNRGAADPMPRIVVALANLASLAELRTELEDRLASLTREGPRYGLHFVVTATSASAARMRLRQSFAVEIPTMLNDQSDYLSILGSLVGVVPPRQVRRGIVRVGARLLEFQGASVADAEGDEDEVIAEVARVAREAWPGGAAPIPQLPERVHIGDMGMPATGRSLPIGLSKRGITPVHFDLGRCPYLLVMGDDGVAIGRYLRGLREALERAGGLGYRFVDPQGVLGDVGDTSVLQAEGDVVSFVEALGAGEECPELIVFTSVAQTVASLPAESSEALKDYLANERGAGKTAIVAASERWRVSSVYEDWYKVVSSQGNGVWVGGGFSEQATFRFPRSLPEYRQPAERSDGFCVVRGTVTWVRLLEAADEPRGA